MKSNLLSLAVASAFTGVLGGCDPAPQPDEDAYRYRATADLTAQYRNPPRAHPDRILYQTEYIGFTTFTDNEGVEFDIASAGCVELEGELTDQDYEANRRVRVKLVDAETGVEMRGTIEASRLVRAPWREPASCTATAISGEIPASAPINHFAAPAASPI